MTYFKNDWQRIASIPSDRFQSVPFNLVDHKAGSWQLDAPVQVVVRVQNSETGAITEKVYKSQSRARTFITNQEQAGNFITAYTNEQMYSTVAVFTDDDDDEDDACDD
jgi:hypothetical protein